MGPSGNDTYNDKKDDAEDQRAPLITLISFKD
jgi:hypothetical protein